MGLGTVEGIEGTNTRKIGGDREWGRAWGCQKEVFGGEGWGGEMGIAVGVQGWLRGVVVEGRYFYPHFLLPRFTRIYVHAGERMSWRPNCSTIAP